MAFLAGQCGVRVFPGFERADEVGHLWEILPARVAFDGGHHTQHESQERSPIIFPKRFCGLLEECQSLRHLEAALK